MKKLPYLPVYDMHPLFIKANMEFIGAHYMHVFPSGGPYPCFIIPSGIQFKQTVLISFVLILNKSHLLLILQLCNPVISLR